MNIRSAFPHRRILPNSVAIACAFALTAFTALQPPAARANDQHVDETARTANAVMAVDQHWLEAETRGDTAWLARMLMPDYRSISAEGKVLDKPTLLAHAEKNRDSDAMRKQVEAWLKTHPVKQSVVMHGDVAILSFSDPKTGRVRSSDTFVYQDGGWHALYSQHSKFE